MNGRTPPIPSGAHHAQNDIDPDSKVAESERRHILRERYSHRSKRNVIGTPPPVKGRRHEIIQTDRFLEELFVKPNEYSVECQTDLYLYEPPDAPHVPTKSGVDVGTGSDDNPLVSDTESDYDTDIVSILDILVELAMKQAIYEFLHEENMADQQLEAKQLLAHQMTANRLDAKRAGSRTSSANRAAGDETSATALLQEYLSALLPDVLVSIDDVELQRPDSVDALEPWLANEIAMEIGGLIDSRESLEKLIRSIVETQAVLDRPTDE